MIATGFGCGLAPVAPGTVGSILGAALWWFALADLDFYTRTAAAFAGFFLAVVIIERVVQRHGLGDEPAIVLDEVVGMWFALLYLPKSIWWVCVAFVLFRIADIAKPWPVSWADRRVEGGIGIVFDDVIAGLMALVVALTASFALG